MDKKKVIISTIVAVTFLIILIIGATYAFFQASNNASGTTNLTGETTKIGNVVVTNPTENLYLKLGAYEMQESQKWNWYYAVDEEPTGNTAYSTSQISYSIAQAQVVGGDIKSNYSCSFNLNITKPSVIKSGDMYIGFTDAKAYDLKINNSEFNLSAYDLSSMSESNKVTFNINGGNTKLVDLLHMYIIFNNGNEQSYLIDQDLGVTISLSDLECTVSDGVSFYAYDVNNDLIKAYPKDIYNIEESGNETYNLYDLKVEKVVIADGIIKVGNSRFYGESFTKLELPSTLKSIGENAFSSNSELTTITISNGVTEISNYAFTFCPNITTIIIDENNPVYNSGDDNNVIIETLNNKLIKATNSVTNIPNGIKIIGEMSVESKTIDNLTIPGSVETIELGAFQMSTIQNLIIEEGLKNIGSGSFGYGANIENLVIPKSVTNIESSSFNWSTINNIKYRGTEEEWNAITKAADWNSNVSGNFQITYNYTG